MLRSGLCDYSDAHVWVKGTITVTNPNNNANFDRRLALKNNAPFISCASKINGELVENAEKTSGSLFNYYRDEPTEAEIANDNGAINISIRNSKSFDYKTEITGSLDAGEDGKEDVTIAIPLKYLGNFWGSLHIRLINCEITLILS